MIYTTHDVEKYFATHWSVCYLSIAIYLFGIYYGQKWMEMRKPLNLKLPLFVWNIALALFSLASAARALSEFHLMFTKYDVYTSVCLLDPPPGCNARAFWMALFTFSKIVELGDTAFIILRKRRLIFLHWYHHITVLYLSWTAAAEGSAAARYFLSINAFIHLLMYTYFALQSIGIKTKKTVSMTITLLQISQMVAGLFVVYYSVKQLWNGRACENSWHFIRISLIVYASYLLLFAHFFYKAYILGKKKSPSEFTIIDNRDSNGNFITLGKKVI